MGLYPRVGIRFGVLFSDEWSSSRAYLKPWNATITIVTLSKLLQFKAFFIMHSAPWPRDSWMSGFSLLFTVFQTQSTQSQSFSLSKIPSHPKMMKSWESSNLKDQMSGFAEITWDVYFASKSPKVRQTESLPGNTLIGPIIISGGISLPESSNP